VVNVALAHRDIGTVAEATRQYETALNLCKMQGTTVMKPWPCWVSQSCIAGCALRRGLGRRNKHWISSSDSTAKRPVSHAISLPLLALKCGEPVKFAVWVVHSASPVLAVCNDVLKCARCS
jgi:hypothetical protein